MVKENECSEIRQQEQIVHSQNDKSTNREGKTKPIKKK